VKKFAQGIKVVIFLSIGVGILYWMYLNSAASYVEYCKTEGISEENCNLLTKLKQDFLDTDKTYVFISILLFILTNIIRANRWNQLLTPLGYQTSFLNRFASINVGYLLNLTIPRSGEFVRAGIISKYENVKFEEGFGTIVTERVVDFVCLLIALLLGIAFQGQVILDYIATNSFLARENVISSTAIYLFTGFVLITLGFLIYFRKQLIKTAFFQKILQFLKGLWAGFISIRNLKNPIWFIIQSLAIWVLYYLMTYVMFFAFEATSHLSAESALTTFLFGSLGMVFPSPGGMGSYHFLIQEALLIYGVPLTETFSFANIIFFTIQIFGIILLGLVSLIYLPMRNPKKS